MLTEWTFNPTQIKDLKPFQLSLNQSSLIYKRILEANIYPKKKTSVIQSFAYGISLGKLYCFDDKEYVWGVRRLIQI